jgi:hypothetical protein
MSGPIIRKYGFPNHDAIFGKRDLEHGADEAAKPKTDAEAKAQGDKTAPADASKSKDAK